MRKVHKRLLFSLKEVQQGAILAQKAYCQRDEAGCSLRGPLKTTYTGGGRWVVSQMSTLVNKS